MGKSNLEHLILLLLLPGAAFAGLDYHPGLLKFEDQTQALCTLGKRSANPGLRKWPLLVAVSQEPHM